MRYILPIILILLFLPVSPLIHQEKIKEQVEVKWWLLPLFAVDSRENSITDLDKGDLELWVDEHRVEDFQLYRRDFNVGERVQEQKKVEQPVVETPPIKKSKMIFLIFDTLLTTPEATRRAKVIAKNIVSDAAANNRFVVITIDPISGINYKGGPLNEKRKIINIIDEEVKEKVTKRYLREEEYILQVAGKFAKYSSGNIRFFREQGVKYLKARSMPFFESFGTFYFNINSIKDNKFTYLFSEGVSNFQMGVEKGSIYYQYLKWIAEFLGRCGSVLFVINPADMLSTDRRSNESGKPSLEYLASESQGKYIQGSKESITKRLNNFHRAYYEIAFADSTEFTGDIHRVRIKSKRKGVRIHSLSTMERSKKYADMNEIEREILVLNLISQNPLYETTIVSKGVRVLKESQSKGKSTYKISLPKDYLNKKIVLYKVVTDQKTSETRIEKETLFPRKSKINVVLNAEEEMDTDFVLLNEASGTALIQGPGIYDDILEITKKGKALSDKPEFRIEMENYLKEATGYCKNLEEAAFRCFCKETIQEVYKSFNISPRPLPGSKTNLSNFGGDDSGDISTYSSWITEEQAISKSFRKRREKQIIRKFVYDYQMISSKDRVEERRKLLSKSALGIKRKDDHISDLVFSFLTEKAIFGPITLLAEDRQEKFNFRLLKFEKHQGRRFAVIEAVPKVKKGSSFAYGEVWLDTADHSVRKIKLDPRSIQGYQQLIRVARELKAWLNLSCEIEYDTINKGIRFPTRITISETYKGGPNIRKYRGGKSWERRKTIVSYTDYKFFDVDARVEDTELDRD